MIRSNRIAFRSTEIYDWLSKCDKNPHATARLILETLQKHVLPEVEASLELSDREISFLQDAAASLEIDSLYDVATLHFGLINNCHHVEESLLDKIKSLSGIQQLALALKLKEWRKVQK